MSDDGTVMLVEPYAGDHVEDNLNPVGRAFYGFSTVICTPASEAQEVGFGLGAQAVEPDSAGCVYNAHRASNACPRRVGGGPFVDD